MTGRREAAHHAGALRVMRRIRRGGAAFAAADLDFADHAARRVDQPGGRQRPDRERRRRGVAADAAHVLRGLQLGAMQLRQAVDELRQPRRIRVRLAVPLVVAGGVAQAEVGAEIDDAIGERRELIDPAHRAAVRQAEEQQIAFLDRFRSHELQLRAFAKIRMREVDELAVEPLARDLLHLEMRMREREAQQFAAGIAGGADD